MTEDQEPPEKSFRLMYRSRIRIPVEDRRVELGALFSTARSNNKKRDITGALLLTDEHFVQTLEGDEQLVRRLYARIGKDPRHEDVELVEAGVEVRVFARWAMAKVSREEDQPDLPLIAHRDGIHKAAGRSTTAEQEALLDVMREVARGGPVAD